MDKVVRPYTQLWAIITHLKLFGSITTMEAFEKYGCTRLSARIYELRNLGYDIGSAQETGKNRYGRPCSYARYYLVRRADDERRNTCSKVQTKDI